MKVSKLTAFLGLNGLADNTKFNVSGASTVGSAMDKVALPPSDIIYALRFVMFSGAAILNLTAGTTATSTALVAGSQKIVTITCTGAVQGASGNFIIPVTVVATGMANQVLNVAVKAGDAADVWAVKVRKAMRDNSFIAERFEVGGIGTNITLGQLPMFNDGEGFKGWATPTPSLSIAIATGTALVTPTNSTVQAAGAITSGVKVYGGDGKDQEGLPLPSCLNLTGLDVKSTVFAHTVAITSTAHTVPVKPVAKSGRFTEAFLDGAAIGAGNLLTFTASGAGLSDIQIGISGKSP